jgi:hypothetical protein
MAERLLENWRKGYLEYTGRLLSPGIFHLWVCYSTLAASVARNVWVDRGFFKVWPNIFVVLVAPPGRCAKNTAIRQGVDLLKAMPNPPNLLPPKVTPQFLIHALANSVRVNTLTGAEDSRSTGFLCVSEMGIAFDKAAVNQGVYQVLTALYDGDDFAGYGTISRDQEKLNDLELSMLAGTTPTWIKAELPATVIGEGLASRTVFVFQERRDRELQRMEKTERESQLETCLLRDLIGISELSGEMLLTAKAKDALFEIEKKEMDLLEKIDDDMTANYHVRRPTHLLKVAMLESLAASDELVIDVEHLALADMYLQRTEETLEDLFTMISSEPIGDKVRLVLNKIEKIGMKYQHNWCPRATLVSHLSHKMNTRELDQHIETLIAGGKIERKLLSSKGGKIMTSYFRLRDLKPLKLR